MTSATDVASAPRNDDVTDVAIVGGGVAGLTAAIALSRFRRSVVVIDAGQPRNEAATELHNFLGHDGVDPNVLLACGRTELAGFGGRLMADEALGADRMDGLIVLALRSGATIRARRVIVASGTSDELPAVAGIEARWGRDVIHCPYCHGWEVRDQKLAVLATNAGAAVHQALMFYELSADVRVFTHLAETFGPEHRAQLEALDITVVDGQVSALVVEDDQLTGLRLADGRVEPAATLVVATGLRTRSSVLDALGVSRDTDGLGGYLADAVGATSAPGVWVAGNVTDPYGTLIVAAAEGMTAAGQVNADLIAHRARRALLARAA